MAHYFSAQDLELTHFETFEFDRPEKIHGPLLRRLDRVRHLCGFPIRVTSDARTEEDLIRIYGSLEEATDSPHQVRSDGWAHAVDVQPAGELAFGEFHRRKAMIYHHAFQIYLQGDWERQGLELGTSHVHLDNDPKLKRPYWWGGRSRG